MSMNLHLGVTISGYRAERVEEIRREVEAVLVREEIAEDLGSLGEGGGLEGRFMSARSDPDRPVVITGAFEWAKRVGEALREAAVRANGGPCHVRFDWDDADEGREEPEDE